MKLFCNHDYEMVNHFVTESVLEQFYRLYSEGNTCMNTTKKYITDYKCKECGKLKRFVETNK